MDFWLDDEANEYCARVDDELSANEPWRGTSVLPVAFGCIAVMSLIIFFCW